MKTSHSVTWHGPDGEAHVGRLELGAKALRLTEDADGGPTEVRYDELQGVSFRYLELTRHRLLLTAHEAIFEFESADSDRAPIRSRARTATGS